MAIERAASSLLVLTTMLLTMAWPRVTAAAPPLIEDPSDNCGLHVAQVILDTFFDDGQPRSMSIPWSDNVTIDFIEEQLRKHGVEASQEFLAIDTIGDPKLDWLPAIVLLTESSGKPHFAIVWSRENDDYFVSFPHSRTDTRITLSLLKKRLYRDEQGIPVLRSLRDPTRPVTTPRSPRIAGQHDPTGVIDTPNDNCGIHVAESIHAAFFPESQQPVTDETITVVSSGVIATPAGLPR